MTELLKINNLIVAFKNTYGEMTAVKGVSLSLDAGKTLALVGESGCGKTVLCKSMLKILCEKGCIKQGEIFLEGRDLVPVTEKEMVALRGGNIAMVFQDPMTSLDPAFSVGEQIAEVLRIHKGLSRRDAKARAIELMELVKIPEAALRHDQRPYQFSGGMRQRIVIAIALAGEPKLLLADEPTTALDEETQEEILKLLKEIQQQTKVAVLFITHDLSLVEDIAQQVVIMKDGCVVEQGDVKKVFADPHHEYTKKLLGYLDYKKGKGHDHKNKRKPTGASLDEVYSESSDADLTLKKNDGEQNSRGQNATCDEEQVGCRAEPILKVTSLCKSFSLGHNNINKVLKDFDMRIYQGEIVGLVGRSGCGKSTLARCIMGLEKPDSGELSLGESIKTQMIFQDSQSAFNDRMTVEQIIVEPVSITRKKLAKIASNTQSSTVSNTQITSDTKINLNVDIVSNVPRTFAKGTSYANVLHDKIIKIMKKVELDTSLIDRKPYELSGGQRQRVAIARALITDPDFIIADEPLTGLDVSSQAQIVHLLKRLADEQGLTILFIAHDIPMVNHISSRIIKI